MLENIFQERITPATIAETTFRIPLYQRPYAWEEPQVSQLLTDLHEAFKDGRESGMYSDYYIGILSIAQTPDDSARYDLIDGQQRITTLMLIGKAAKSKSNFNDWQEFFGIDRLDLYGRIEDKKFLNGEAASGCNRRMVDAVQCVEKFFDENFDKMSDRTAFSSYIYHHAAFFLAEVPSTYSLLDKNQQFVRMNNRGRQLEKHEILKVQLLTKINDEGVRTNAFSIWNDMVECLTGISDAQQGVSMKLRAILDINDIGNEPEGDEVLYTSILTVPEFLLLALFRYLPPEKKTAWTFKTDKLLESYSVLKDEECIIAFAKALQNQVEIFRSFFIFLSRQEKYELGGKSDTEDKDFVFGNSQYGKKRLIAAQSFLYVSTESHHWMIDAFDWCENQVRPINSEKFTNELEKIDNSLNNSTNPNWGRKISSIMDLETMTYRNISHYWFYRLDYELWKIYFSDAPDPIWSNLPKRDKSIRGLVENFRFRRCGSVEHIVPQKTMDGNSNEETDDTFGNLALISSSRNSKFSNNPKDGKKAIILQSQPPYTESLKMLHFLWCDSNSASHGKVMYEIFEYTQKNLTNKV